ncbi:hypothetical protein LTR66_017540, partial [Elasticomyces elasticus]
MASSPIPPPPSWVLDLQNPPPSRAKNADKLPDPPGYTSSKALTGKKATVSTRKVLTPEETDTLKLKKSWEIALGPAKQLPMQGIMSYM